jgi:hypothetical protein
VLSLFAACGSVPCPIPADQLPDRVNFRTATDSFNTDWYVVVREGLMCVKPNEETGVREPGEWMLVGSTGLPRGSRVNRADPPEAIVEISADGCHLHAISSQGRFYRGSDLRHYAPTNLTWTDHWPGAQGEGITIEVPTDRGWSVSDSHTFDVDRYTDITGYTHSVGLGVAHVYRLGPEGLRIYYNDWWLPADWSRQLCGPERGTFRAVNISASASTLFVIDERGRMFTRLWDFDTAGENDLLTYTYLPAHVTDSIRGLPAEPWLRQPDVEVGRITRRITIFQDGEDNDARVLRVEGELEGVTGYYEKRIDGDSWAFIETGEPIDSPFLDPLQVEADPVSPSDATLSGTLSRENSEITLGIELLDFNLFCSPALARLTHDGEELTVDGQPLELAFHHVQTMLEEVRPRDYWQQGTATPIRGALLITDGIEHIDDEAAREAAMTLFDDREVINFMGNATTESLDLREIPRSIWYLRPPEEKGDEGELYQLSAVLREVE